MESSDVTSHMLKQLEREQEFGNMKAEREFKTRIAQLEAQLKLFNSQESWLAEGHGLKSHAGARRKE